MAARLNRLHQDCVRKKIQADKIILSLQNHVAGKSELSATQIQAAKILLDKSISNAPTDVNVGGQSDNPVTVSIGNSKSWLAEIIANAANKQG